MNINEAMYWERVHNVAATSSNKVEKLKLKIKRLESEIERLNKILAEKNIQD